MGKQEFVDHFHNNSQEEGPNFHVEWPIEVLAVDEIVNRLI